MATDEREPADPGGEQNGQQLALVEGAHSTREALERWSAAPGPVLGGWFAGALGVAVALLTAVWIVSLLSTPDVTSFFIAGVAGADVDLGDYLRILGNNGLVLALHATACVAGFIAGSSLPLIAKDMRGLRRIVHERAGPIAIAWVIAVTSFSLLAQAYALGFDGATIAAQLRISSGLLIITVLPHALLELTAVFLPLAAWLIASRRNEWGDLLAATLVTTAIAIPMLLVAAAVELYVWPELLGRASPVL